MWVTEASVTLTVVKDSMGSDILRKKFWVEFVDCVLAGKNTLPEGWLKNSDWGRGSVISWGMGSQILYKNSLVGSQISLGPKRGNNQDPLQSELLCVPKLMLKCLKKDSM